jgi:hypothetical protein
MSHHPLPYPTSGVSYCEPKRLYLALLGILQRSGRTTLAADVWRTATKKFNTSCKVCTTHQQKRGDCSGAQQGRAWRYGWGYMVVYRL